MTETAMRELVRAAVTRLGSLRAAARQWGITPSYLSDTLTGRRAPGPKILGKLGYERLTVTTYRRTK